MIDDPTPICNETPQFPIIIHQPSTPRFSPLKHPHLSSKSPKIQSPTHPGPPPTVVAGRLAAVGVAEDAHQGQRQELTERHHHAQRRQQAVAVDESQLAMLRRRALGARSKTVK